MTTFEPSPVVTPLADKWSAAPPMAARQDSIATMDMHIPGAWVGTNPSTPAPLSEDMKYFGQALKTLPGKVQEYLPAKDPNAPASTTWTDRAASMVPASVTNTAANILPASLQPTMKPTAADSLPPEANPPLTDKPPISTTTNTISHQDVEAPKEEEGATWKDKVASVLPAGALSAATAYLPSSLNPKANPTAADAAPTPTGEHEGLNSPLPPVPDTKEKESTPLSPTFSPSTEPLVGSSVSPDEDVQAALEKAANPDEYKVEVIPPMKMEESSIVSAVPASRLKEDDRSIVESTRAVGGRTPVTPLDSENASTSKFTEKAAADATSLGVGANVFAADHALKDQKAAAEHRQDLEPTTKDSFMHVVIPATPGAGVHEQEKFNAKKAHNGTLATPTKKKERSGSLSAGEASPSSPSKGGVFSGIRKLTKKRHRSTSRGHSREVSADEMGREIPAVPAKGNDTHGSQDSNSTDPSPTSANGTEKRERHVLHKDPPAGYGASANEDGQVHPEGVAEQPKQGSTPSMLANPFSPNSPSASSPSKVAFKDKIKGEIMMVQGKLTRDEGLKEAGEKRKKGTL
ncbi:hypothetical protein CPB86DRAFT_787300 [Serendipita vermifera]|nr:hypothetical protein CPB86DRAFT_787300 [Serendipita vermifera]